ncbi:MAG TPA: M13-type metalloendopeptidase [Actinomycetaceae bacterium]|nr:M13-type metalloendopeptidase [Actinomycetaceae bacterium]
MTETRAVAATTETPTAAPRPQDDLYLHVNGAWLRDHVIPADRGSDGAFRELRDQSELHVRQIIEDCASGAETGPDANRIGSLYGSFMDVEAIETAGAEPLQTDLTRIAEAANKDDLAEASGALAPTGVVGPFYAEVSNDPSDPETYTTYLLQGGLGLPDEAYYREEIHADVRTKYVEHLSRMMELAGLGGREEADRIMALETKLAGGHWNIVDLRDADRTNNPMDFATWAGISGAFPVDLWREATGTPGVFEKLHVMTPSYFGHLGEVWENTSLLDLKLWLSWGVLRSRAAYLSEAFVQQNFEFYGRVLTGAQELRERWKRGVSFVDGAVPEAVGRIYVARHFPPASKARMDHLVSRLIDAYRESITHLDWMGAETKDKALVKLDGFYPKIGYPSEWRDYSELETSDDLLGNVREANRFEWNRQSAKVGGPVDREEWLMPPQMVNAYYMPTSNEIAFPAAILQPPFFDPAADDALNYGGIGAVIGHEIGHGFDDQGSKYGPTGKFESWWTDEDRAAFEERTAALIEQYDGLVPAQFDSDEHHVNGALTIGENIGDLGGLSIALKAYRIELASRGSSFDDEPGIDGATALQRVFLNWGRIWREKARDEYLIQRMATDPHSPDEFRCNQVAKNVPEFHEAFRTGDSDGMWLAPEERVRIW